MQSFQFRSVLVVAFVASTARAGIEATSSCADRVSTGDQSVGISAVADASCVSGGLGCFPYGDQCRFCRESDSSQAMHLEMCPESDSSMSAATDSSEQLETPTNSEQSAACQTESATKSPTSPEEAAVDCLSLVSVGDLAVGISAVAATNPTCSATGLGCFQSGQCRYCRTRATTQSASFLTCSGLGGTSTSTPTSSPTTTPVSTPSPTAASTSTTCSSVVLRSGLTGISFVSESRCNVAAPTLLGCSARTSCRLCRNSKNEANQYLISCNILKTQGVTESTATNSSYTEYGTTESEAINSSSVDPYSHGSGDLTVSTESINASPASISAPIGAVAAIVALVVVAIMSVMYIKGRRDLCDEPSTPDNCPDCDVFTPNGGHDYMPRQGSLVQVQSQSSIATL